MPAWAFGGAAALGAALLAGTWLHGRSTGAAAERADQIETAAAVAEGQRLRARAAAVDYEAKRAAGARRATQPSPESRYALTAKICPPPGTFGRPLELGDVPVPGVELDRLRDAGADF